MKGVAFLHSMDGIGFLVVILCVISIVLATASPFATLALKMRPSNTHFSPIIPYFMPPQNIFGPAAATTRSGQCHRSSSSTTRSRPMPQVQQQHYKVRPMPQVQQQHYQPPANVASKTSNQTGTGGFLSKGTINSLIQTPTGNWIATGNWSMSIDNGSLTGFGTNMTWFNSNGKASHTHEFHNLRAGAGTIQGNNIIINGLTDVGTNHRVVWKNVPTTISIQGGKTIRISVADNATNHHFAGQPVFGLVTSFVPCSDVPGPNMEVLPSCQK